jgi:hypothetical protein
MTKPEAAVKVIIGVLLGATITYTLIVVMGYALDWVPAAYLPHVLETSLVVSLLGVPLLASAFAGYWLLRRDKALGVGFIAGGIAWTAFISYVVYTFGRGMSGFD